MVTANYIQKIKILISNSLKIKKQHLPLDVANVVNQTS